MFRLIAHFTGCLLFLGHNVTGTQKNGFDCRC